MAFLISVIGRHWRNLSNRLSLLVTLAVVLALLLVGVYFDLFLRKSFEQATAERMAYAYQRLTSELDELKTKMISGTNFAQTDELILASTDLINSYGISQEYNAFLIDEEKKSLAQELLKRVKLSFNDDIALYGAKNELIAFASREGNSYRLGYVSLVDGDRTFWSHLEDQQEYQRDPLPGDFDAGHVIYTPIELVPNSQTVTLHRRGASLVVKVHQHVTDPLNGRQIAHLELSRVLDATYFERLSQNLAVNLRLGFEKPSVALWPDVSSLETFEGLRPEKLGGEYVSAISLPTLNGPAYVQASIKSNLQTELLTVHRYRFVALFLVLGIAILWAARHLLSRTLTQPMSRLMDQIHRIERGDYTREPALVTGDELQEISHNINELATAVQEREDSLEKARYEQEFLSNHDVLTGLANRRLFSDRLEHALDLARRQHSELAVLFMDLDQFKMVNDTLGHDVGDALLVQVGQRLAQHVRETDTLARIGGDEFNLLIEQVHSLTEVEGILNMLMDAFRKPFVFDGHEINTSVSIGVAMYPRDGMDSVTLLKNADLAVYKSKDSGRAAFSFFSEDLSQRARRRGELIMALNSAISAGDQFELYYQPKVDAQTGQIVSAEALIRWNSPDLGMVPPVQFIPLAEETGKIIDIGNWVVQQACRDLAKMRADQVLLNHLSFNVSSVQLASDELRDVLANAIKANGLEASWLEMEITESVFANNMHQAIAALESFRATGMLLAIDDFGTGYSSMSYLHKLPFTRVKVDKSFVDGLPNSPDSISITRAILSLAKHFDLETTAEGVETAEQLAFLRQEGCSEIQGYYYSKPLPFDQFIEFYRSKQSTNPALK